MYWDVGLIDDFEKLTKREMDQRERVREQQRVLDEIVEQKRMLKDEIESQLSGGGGRSPVDQVPLALPVDQPTRGEIEAANAVREMGVLVTAEMLAHKLGIPVKAAATRLGRAYAKRLLVRAGRGRYRHPSRRDEGDDDRSELVQDGFDAV